MEKVVMKSIAVLTPSDVDELEFTIPSWVREWTFLIVPKNTVGTPDDSSFELQYVLDGVAYPTNPTSTGDLQTNAANEIERSVGVGAVRLLFTNGVTPPDGGIDVYLYGARSN